MDRDDIGVCIIIFVVGFLTFFAGYLTGLNKGKQDIEAKVYAKDLRLKSCVEDDARIFNELLQCREQIK